MKTLIVYYSANGLTGKNGKIAEELHQKIGGDIDAIEEFKTRRGVWSMVISGFQALFGKHSDLKPMKTKAGDYDLVIITTPFWAGKLPPPTRTYLRANKDKFKKIALLSVSGSGDKNAPVALPDIEKTSGLKPVTSIFISEEEFKNRSYMNNLVSFAEELLEK